MSVKSAHIQNWRSPWPWRPHSESITATAGLPVPHRLPLSLQGMLTDSFLATEPVMSLTFTRFQCCPRDPARWSFCFSICSLQPTKFIPRARRFFTRISISGDSNGGFVFYNMSDSLYHHLKSWPFRSQLALFDLRLMRTHKLLDSFRILWRICLLSAVFIRFQSCYSCYGCLLHSNRRHISRSSRELRETPRRRDRHGKSLGTIAHWIIVPWEPFQVCVITVDSFHVDFE
jgi:hypothetical protein